MKHCDWTTILELAVSHVGKPAVYYNNGLDSVDENIKLFDLIRVELSGMIEEEVINEIITQPTGLIFCGSQDESDKIMELFSSDEFYKSSFYAIQIDETGTIITENR